MNNLEISDCGIQGKKGPLGKDQYPLIPPPEELFDFFRFIRILQKAKNTGVEPLRIGYSVRP